MDVRVAATVLQTKQGAVRLAVLPRMMHNAAMTHERITRDPAILMGKPCIRGTRISVEVLMRRLAVGRAIDEIAAEFPEITREDVLAAAAYAADLVRHDGLIAAE